MTKERKKVWDWKVRKEYETFSVLMPFILVTITYDFPHIKPQIHGYKHPRKGSIWALKRPEKDYDIVSVIE